MREPFPTLLKTTKSKVDYSQKIQQLVHVQSEWVKHIHDINITKNSLLKNSFGDVVWGELSFFSYFKVKK